MDEPFTQELSEPEPMWPTMRTDLNKPTTLLATVEFKKAFVGGGCADFAVKNLATVPCQDFEIELNIRPEWGEILGRGGSLNLRGSSLAESDAAAGPRPGHTQLAAPLHVPDYNVKESLSRMCSFVSEVDCRMRHCLQDGSFSSQRKGSLNLGGFIQAVESVCETISQPNTTLSS